MNKNERKFQSKNRDFYEDEEESFFNNYIRTKEKKKEKRIRRALKTRDISELMSLEEEYE